MEQTSSQKWFQNLKQRLKTRYDRRKLNIMVRMGHVNDPKKYHNEEKDVGLSFFSSYVAKKLLCCEDGKDKRSFRSDPIFRYIDEIQVEEYREPYSGFVFSGEVCENFGEVKQEITKGNYIKCKDLVEIRRKDRKRANRSYIKNGSKVGPDGPYALSSVIITGTCDDTKCKELKKQFEKDMVWLAKDGGLNRKHPFSVIRTFDIIEDEDIDDGDNVIFIDKGDLIEARKDEEFMTRLSLNHIHCPFYAIVKTRLSGKREVGVGAILADLEVKYDPEKVCNLIYMRKLLNKNDGYI